jgi:hypothetical protein
VSSIVVEVPDALKSLVPVLTDFLRLTEAAVLHARADEPLSLPAWERLCSSMGAALECAATREVLLACVRDERRLWIAGRLCRPVGVHSTTFYAMRGPIELCRTLYRPLDDARAPALDPIAVRGGMVRKTWLPETAAAMAFLVQLGPAREAVDICSQLGVLPYSASSFEAVTHEVGEHLGERGKQVMAALRAGYEVPEGAAGIVVSLDRVATPFEEPVPRRRGRPKKGAPKKSVKRAWRMSYCATVSVHDAKGKALKTLRYGCMPNEDIAAVVAGLAEDVRDMLRKCPGLRVSALCDGAKEMWNLLGEEMTEAKLGVVVAKLVDLWHLLEKLGKAFRVRYDDQRARQELQRWKMRLLNRDGAWCELFEQIESWGLVEPEAASDSKKERPVHDALTFLRNQGEAGRLHYPRSRREGRPVGSGPVEATCKSLFNMRFKRGGARWKEPTGKHIVRLRALAQSRRWVPAMALLLPELPMEVRRAG